MRVGITRQVALMHPNRAVDAHEPVHLGSIKGGSRWARILPVVDLGLDDVFVLVDVVAIDGRQVIVILFTDAEAAGWCGEFWAARADR